MKSCRPAQVGSLYYVRISATNAAGLEGFAASPAVKVVSAVSDLTPAKLAGIILSVVLGTGTIVAVLTLWLTRIRCPCRDQLRASVSGDLVCAFTCHAATG